MDMDPSSAQHQQMSNQSLENMIGCSKAQQERKARPQPEQALKCPRCDSTNTKFCYYNNYSLSQPRYFCKSCRRYWTKGGTLRSVPVGGGCRKNKRSSSAAAASSKRVQDQAFTPNPNPLLTSLTNPLSYDSNDLTLAFARLQKQSLGYDHDQHDHLSILGNPSSCDNIGSNVFAMNHSSTTGHTSGFLDALRSSGFLGAQNSAVYYGYGCGGNSNNNGDNMGEVDNGNGCGGAGVSADMMLNYDQEMSVATTQAVTVTTMKQEICSGREQSSESNRVLWGFPWQLNETNIGEPLDSGRGGWNGFTSSSWHGLLNSPLM